MWIWTFAAVSPCAKQDSAICRATWSLTHDAALTRHLNSASIFINLTAIVVGAWIVQRLIRRAIKRTVSSLQGDMVQRGLSSLRRRTPRMLLNTGENVTLRRAQRAETIGALLRSTASIAVYIIAGGLILGQFSLKLGPLIAGAGVATAALAFGAQNIVRDFLAGFFIVLEDQYGVGDVVDVEAASGTVESVSLRITRLRSADGTLWHVPNGEIKKVGNKSQQWSRALLSFSIGLNADTQHAIAVIKGAADTLWHDPAYTGIILEEPEVWGPEQVDASGVLLRLAVKTKPLEQWRVSRVLRLRTKLALEAAGISLATPPAPEE